MPIRGKPQAHRRAAYDASSGRPWRTGVQITPAEAEKAIRAADATGLSFSGFVTELIRRLPVDESGKPTWAGELNDTQEELPKAG